MSRAARGIPLSPPKHPIERIVCSVCGRTWAVYEGKTPRLWSVHASQVFCDRRACNAALDRARADAEAEPGYRGQATAPAGSDVRPRTTLD